MTDKQNMLMLSLDSVIDDIGNDLMKLHDLIMALKSSYSLMTIQVKRDKLQEIMNVTNMAVDEAEKLLQEEVKAHKAKGLSDVLDEEIGDLYKKIFMIRQIKLDTK